MRLLATISIQPHTKSRITPQRLLPLPWDYGRTSQKEKARITSKEEDMKRFEKLVKRLES